MSNLAQQSCSPISKDSQPLEQQHVNDYLAQVTGWELTDTQYIKHDFTFSDYYQTMAFVNAVAEIAHQQDHHPDMQLGYNHCTVSFTTHAVNGLTLNDFICAAKINALL